MKKYYLLVLSMAVWGVSAQTMDHYTTEWEKYLQELSSQEDYESTQWDDYYDQLTELAEHPLDINTMQKEDFEQLPFLSAQQIEDIQAYIYQYGGMRSLGELAMIRSLDYLQCQLLRSFTFAGNVDKPASYPSLKNILKYGKQEIVATAKVPFYNRKGDENGYLGYKYKHWLKYSFSMGQFLKMGILASQDAGEPFLSNKNSLGYDYYTFWFQIRKMGRLKNLTLGRYRLKFGMGLVMNNDFGLGKMAMLSTLGRNSNNIKTHSSRYAANYLQGVAATVALNKYVDLSMFLSYRKIDATLNKDSAHSIATIVNTGYHRTAKEMEKKNDASATVAGTHLQAFRNGYHIGATAFYNTFDRELRPKTSQLFRKYYPQGKDFYNMSIDYGYTSRRLNVSGETATGDCKALATINTVSYLFQNDLSVVLLHRFYSFRYHSLYSSSFAAGGSVQDEHGIYLGASWSPTATWSLMAYTDYAYFVWPKYGHSRSSQVWDNLLSATWKKKKWTGNLRYQIRFKDTEEKNRKGKVTAISTMPEQRLRMGMTYSDSWWTSTTQADCCYSQLKGNSFGYMLNENVSMQWKMLKGALHIGYFHTKDYNSRVYIYESGVLYNMAFGMFYGHGMRYAMNLRAEFNKKIMLIAKLGITQYFDRNKISTGLQEIKGCKQTDLDLQLRIKI